MTRVRKHGAFWRHPWPRVVLVGLLFGVMGLPLLGWAKSLAVAGAVMALRALPLAFGAVGGDRLGTLLSGLKAKREALAAGIPHWAKMALPLMALAAAAMAPLGMDTYMLDVGATAGIYVCLALGLNIVVGMAGLLVLGYAAFYAVGAYAYALLNVHFHLSFWVCLPIGGGLAALFGLLLGLPTLRLRGDYLAIVTLGFGEIVRITLNNWDSVTRGPNGILNIDPPSIGSFTFSHPLHYYYLHLAMASLTAFILYRLSGSRLGRAWVAMREDETAAEAMGVPTLRMKLLAFSLAAFFGGVAGVLFAGKQLFVSPESFNFMESVMVLCMVVLGGMGSVPGVIAGALLLAVLPEALRGVAEYRLIVFGAAMVALMRYRPQGLWPSARRMMELKE
jgi:branched-chain amino acid transport system permease protein